MLASLPLCDAISLFSIHMLYIRNRIAILKAGMQMTCIWAWFLDMGESRECSLNRKSVQFDSNEYLDVYENIILIVLNFLCFVRLVSLVNLDSIVSLGFF